MTPDGRAFDLALSPSLHYVNVMPGTYKYSARGRGGATKSGTIDLSSRTSDWKWWCESW